MADEAPWTPYALEPLRRGAKRRRQLLALAALVLLLGAWATIALTAETEKTIDIFANGQQGSVEIKGRDASADRPVTVKVSPGKVVEGTPPPVDGSETRRNAAAAFEPDPIGWGNLLRAYGPLLLIGSVLWLASRPRGRSRDEVNFGIYKGAMPLELHTATHRNLVVTRRAADRSVFGKEREDYVPRETYVPARWVEAVPPPDDREAG